jgi:N-acetylglucosaminyldiphosphoundecaprenol N-acetyl-beta-D-mannosaminyltransferase
MAAVQRLEVEEGSCSACGPRRGALVNGVRIDPVTREGFVETVATFLRCGRSHVVHFCAAHPTVVARRDLEYRAVLNGGDLNVPDGLPVAIAARLSGFPTDRLPGTDALHLVAEWGAPRDLTHAFVGATNETLAALRARLLLRDPATKIVLDIAPPFRPLTSSDLQGLARRVRASGAQILWIGMGAPKQDMVANQLRALEAAPVIMCVGAAFDFAAGVKRRAPAWMRHAGLEWGHRLLSEPGRLWKRYLIGNPQFVAGVVVDGFRRVGRRSSGT